MGKDKKRVHFIAIGGSLMHNLALALHDQGFIVSGSDDQFFDPSKSRLSEAGLLPDQDGWDESRITKDIDFVIVGMHAKKDNPELLRAHELAIKTYSFPEYIFEASLDKQRIVIAGSHGKTTITSMVMHVLKYHKINFDYAVGGQVEGFRNNVKLSEDAAFIVIEGDEYLSSPEDPTPKFFKYQHHIGLVSGIAWDHMNVFPSFENYVSQFEKFVNLTPKSGTLIFNKQDKILKDIAAKNESDILKFEYAPHPAKVKDGKSYLTHANGTTEIQVFGKHNLSNINAAKLVCERLSITDEEFYSAIATFRGAAKRLEVIAENKNTIVFKDFAHSPSKVSATCEAVKQQFKKKNLVACLELHTFSSLNKTFLQEYKGALDPADKAIVYINPDTLAKKGNESISNEEVKAAFARKDIIFISDSEKLSQTLLAEDWTATNLLMMSSADYGGIDLQSISKEITA